MKAVLPTIDSVLDYGRIRPSNYQEWLVALEPTVLIGVSYGAHLCVELARAAPTLDGLILIAPAWTDEPNPHFVSHVNAIAAQGLTHHLETVPKEPAWIHDAVHAAWTSFEPQVLLAHLASVAVSRGPGQSALLGLQVPAVIVGFWDDPMHPWETAKTWASAIPQSRIIGMPMSAPEPSLMNVTAAAMANLSDLRARRIRDLHGGS